MITRGRRRTILGAFLLGAWGLGIAVVVQRGFFRERSAVLAEAALRLGPSTKYFMVEQGGRQIGYASTRIDTTTTGFEVIDQLTAELTVAGQSFPASARAVRTLSRGFALRTFDVAMEAPTAPLRARGVTEGDSAVVFVLEAPGQPADRQRIVVAGPILLPAVIPSAAMLARTPKVGRRIALASIDPTTMTPSTIELRIAAESLFTLVDSARFDATAQVFVAARTDTVRGWRLVPTSGAGFSGWVDAQGRVIEATQPGGISLKRTAFELSFLNWTERLRRARTPGRAREAVPPTDLIEASAIASGVSFDGEGPASLRVRFLGADPTGLDLAGGRQTLRGDTIEIRREGRERLTAPWSLAAPPADFRRTFARELAAEPLLQTGDPAIVALALRLAGPSRDPALVAARMNRWIHDSLEKVVTISIPSATQVLRARRGDCHEHTQLFTALARAVGIPTRIASGLAFVNGRFYYHAWPEIWLRDWVAVDPTFGQFPADAAHLRVVTGGLTRQAELLRLMGTLRLEVLTP
ncbi:MAG: transglutaminase domain-containing protein [Gemmatimonadetes bacterium]|nr:transglutaminase domain-containing protein [Gemmatimonadota bacterium]